MEAFADGRFRREFGEGSCLWRFYGWSPHAVSLGYNQDPSSIDRERCRREGVDIVRRPTGGRAVLHGDEFTYSFITDSATPNTELYRYVHEVLQAGLAGLGVCSEFCRSSLPVRGASAPVACFAASARHELQVDGRKLVGSAQRRSGRVLLQHGSLPFSRRDMDISRFVMEAGEGDSLAVRDELARKTVSLEEILGYIPSYRRLVELMTAALETHGGARVVPIPSEGEDDSGRRSFPSFIQEILRA
ncbi:lipoate--protein ligase family protein [Chlorobium sp. N1]|nr:lipoate--protein ligase family protein [Chlorobium sp. N1]